MSDADSAPDAAVVGGRSAGIVLAGTLATAALQFLSLAVLSRLLRPDDFGLIAMVMVFVVLGNLVRDFGLPTAGLQVRTLSDQQASNLFWLNLAIGAATGLVLLAATPVLAHLFHEPRLTSIVPAFALVTFIGGCAAQFQVRLARMSRFGVLVASDLTGQIAGFAAAVTCAVAGLGYWALVVQALITSVVTFGHRWMAGGWLPTRYRRGHGAVPLLKTGANYGLAHLLAFVQGNIDTLIIGAQTGAAQLGYYNRAFQLMSVPVGRILDPLTQVVVTYLNRVKADGHDPMRALNRIQFGVSLLCVSAFASTAGVAHDLVPMILGAGWEPSVTVYQILAIGGCFAVLNHSSYWAFIAQERSGDLLRYNLVSKPVGIAAIAIGATFGITGAATGYAAVMAASWPLNLGWLAHGGRFAWRPFALTGACVLMAGGAGAWSAHVVSHLGDSGSLLAAGAGLIAGVTTMFVVVLTLPLPRRMFVASAQQVRAIVSGRQGA